MFLFSIITIINSVIRKYLHRRIYKRIYRSWTHPYSCLLCQCSLYIGTVTCGNALHFNLHMLFLDSVCLWFLSRNSFFQEAQVFSFSPVLSVIRTAEVHKEQKQHIITWCRTQLLWAQYKIYRASPFSVFVHSSLRSKQQQHSTNY